MPRSVLRLVVLAPVAVAACGPTPVERDADAVGSIAPQVTAVAPSLAPAAEEIELRVTGEDLDTTISGAPGDTVVVRDLPAGEYALSLVGHLDPWIVWKSGPQRVIVLPGTVSEPVVSPFAFEVSELETTSTLPLTGGASLDLAWTGLAAASEYRVAWAAVADFGTIVADTVVAGSPASVTLGPPGTYFVRVSPVDSAGLSGYPVTLADTVEVQN
jgi:hypothetical protein